MKHKSCPPDFPPDVEIPMGISWSPRNNWQVRRTIKGIDSKPMFFKEFEDAMRYHAFLFADKIEKKKKLEATLKYADRTLAAKRVEEKILREATITNELSIDSLELLTREEVQKKIKLYLERLEILYARDTDLWIKECEAHGF